MRFDSTLGSIGIVSAMLAVLCGCSGGDVLPVGGPFGGGLDPAAIVDGGIVSDGNGVLPSAFIGGGSASASGGTPTWTELYNTYFASGTIGNCTSSCHLGDIGGIASPSALYVWLERQGQIGDKPPALVDPDFSCITWMSSDGTMPYGGPRVDPTGTLDLKAWAADGAKNN